MCWGNGDSEFMGVAKQWLLQLVAGAETANTWHYLEGQVPHL